MQSSREERKAVNLGSVPLGGDPEEKDCLSGDMPQRLKGSSHTVGTPVLGLRKGEMSLHDWLKDC